MERASRAAAIIAVALAAGCRSPTQVTVEATTDVACTSLKGTTITVGQLGDDLEKRAPIAFTPPGQCAAGRIGSLVITPSGDRSGELAIRVVEGVDVAPLDCKPPAYVGCIVARRALRFIPHTELTLPIALSASCKGIECPSTQTCVEGFGCVTATIPDPASCEGPGCGESVLTGGGKPDAGVDAAPDSGGDAGDAGDSGDSGATSPLVDQIATGEGFACALMHGGAVRCWGFNNTRQLGDDTSRDRYTAGVVTGVDGALQISAGSNNACAVLADHTVTCWGTNQSLELGGGTTDPEAGPTKVPGVTGVAEVFVDVRHVCVRHLDKHVTCWGNNSAGEQGVPPDAPDHKPEAVPGVAGAEQLYGTCVLLSKGAVACWGYGASSVAELPGINGASEITSDNAGVIYARKGGVVTSSTHSDATGWGTPQPTIPPPGGHNVVQISAGDALYELLDDGSVARVTSTSATLVDGLGPGSALDVHAGSQRYTAPKAFQCVRRTKGGVACWGSNYTGELGNDKPDALRTPQVVKGASRLSALYAGRVASLDDGSSLAWGEQPAIDVSSPTPVAAPILGKGVIDYDFLATVDRAYAVHSDGSMLGFSAHAIDPSAPLTKLSLANVSYAHVGFDWDAAVNLGKLVFVAARDGANSSGIFGNGSTAPLKAGTTFEVPLTSLAGVSISSAYYGGNNDVACAWLADKTVQCWGSNFAGQCGDGLPATSKPTPGPVAFDDPKPKIIAASTGYQHSCALSDVGEVWCWGSNSAGQIGVPSSVDTVKARRVPGITSAKGVTCFERTTCAWLADKTAQCWGENTIGQLGDGTLVDRSTPAPVLGLTGVIAMQGSCALLEDHTARCWGDSYLGQSGTGVVGGSPTPVDVIGLSP